MEKQMDSNNFVPAGKASQVINPLLKRAFMFLEDDDWESADKYCEKVLDQNPEDGYAYLGKLMAELKIGRKEALADYKQPFSNKNNYQKILRFGDKALISEVEEYNNSAVYNQACRVMRQAKTADDYKRAIAQFESIPDFKDVPERIAKCNAGIEQLRKDFAQLREKITPYQSAFQGMICCGRGYVAGLRADGTVVAAGEKGSSGGNVQNWRDIVGITVAGEQIIGLCSNGTITVASYSDESDNDEPFWGDYLDPYREKISCWKNIIAISGGDSHIAALCADGTVVAAGRNTEGQCNVQDWRDIVAIAAGHYHTAGLRADGTVVSTKYVGGDVGERHNYAQEQVQDWKDIVAIAAGYHTAGLRSDGTVVTTGENLNLKYDRFYRNEIKDWRGIVAIAAHDFFTIGLRADGTVVAPRPEKAVMRTPERGKCNVQDWCDVVAIAIDRYHSAALCSNGTVMVAGNCEFTEGKHPQEWQLFPAPHDIYNHIERLKKREAEAEKARAARKVAEERARAAAEKQRQTQIAALESERADLQASLSSAQDELSNLKGLFIGRRRKELETRITEISSRMDAISKDLKKLAAKKP